MPPRNRATPYHWNVLHSLDVFANSVLGGLRRQTLSARLGLIARNNGGRIPWGSVAGIGRVTYTFLEHIAPGHCAEALRDEEHHWN